MSRFVKSCKKLFGKDNFYEILCIRKNATAQEVKKGYHKLSLFVHPDRVSAEEKKLATQKFQALGRIYSILSDKDRRAAYDETGDVDDEDEVVQQDRDWYDYWRLLFGRVTVKDIDDYKKKYQGSEEEVADLKKAYLESDGDMDVIMGCVLFADVSEEDRLVSILTDLINKGDLPKFKNFTQENKKKKALRRKRAEAEAAEAEEEKKNLGLDNSESSLHAVIQKRQQSRAEAANSFFADLEAKYATPKAGKAGPKSDKSKAQTGKASKKRKT